MSSCEKLSGVGGKEYDSGSRGRAAEQCTILPREVYSLALVCHLRAGTESAKTHRANQERDCFHGCSLKRESHMMRKPSLALLSFWSPK